MVETKIDLHEALQAQFGFDKFKGNQEKIVQSVLDRHDTFVIMPTGGGKSLCFQAPALALALEQVSLAMAMVGQGVVMRVQRLMNPDLTERASKTITATRPWTPRA